MNTKRLKWDDFCIIYHSTWEMCVCRLQNEEAFVEEFAVAFGEWLKRMGDPAREYWDDDHIFENSVIVKNMGFWGKMPVETFLERLKNDIAPEVANVVREGAGSSLR